MKKRMNYLKGVTLIMMLGLVFGGCMKEDVFMSSRLASSDDINILVDSDRDIPHDGQGCHCYYRVLDAFNDGLGSAAAINSIGVFEQVNSAGVPTIVTWANHSQLGVNAHSHLEVQNGNVLEWKLFDDGTEIDDGSSFPTPFAPYLPPVFTDLDAIQQQQLAFSTEVTETGEAYFFQVESICGRYKDGAFVEMSNNINTFYSATEDGNISKMTWERDLCLSCYVLKDGDCESLEVK